MNIAIRLFIGYFLIVGIAAWFLISIFAREVEPGVRHATEETLVDTANVLAELAAEDLAMGAISQGKFAGAVDKALSREPRALIAGVSKHTVNARVYVTDTRGIVQYDSTGQALGADYSQWRDVARVLRGEYGARSTKENIEDPHTSTMYVAAPVMRAGEMIGVLSVAKSGTALQPYADRARERVMRAGFLLLAISAAIGLVFTLWLTWSLNRLRDYALAVAAGKRATPPTSGGRQLSVLARALTQMRAKLDGKHYVEQYVQSLAHELKSPLSGIRGAAELLQESPAPEDSARFVRNINEQSARMQLIIDRLLVLARVEQLQAPEDVRTIVLADLIATTVHSRQQALAERQIGIITVGEVATAVQGDPFLLQQALGNLLDNAIEFSRDAAHITLQVSVAEQHVTLSVRDSGPGVPDYALPHVFERFYSLPRPATGRKSTGLGLAFVQEVAKLHGGVARLTNQPEGGALAEIELALGRKN
ncbi:MAG: two-component system sensor histidine kinase CreC [Rhodocyclaceae bacterium]|nr:two-component system sensor histidine kinase CreC [Rhodocyclaceae bacterium]MBK6908022.1 two-component system sensor histidine kinase CreC [Rhodocyclaceae bacterium]